MPHWLSVFKKRELTPELMDDLSLGLESHIEALQGLEKINQVSFACAPFWKEIKKYFFADSQKPLRVLDVACGGGDLTTALALQARKEKLPIVFEGCDFNPRAVEYARECAKKKNLPVDYFILDALQDAIPDRFDVVISSLFFHHLKTNELVYFLEKLRLSRAKLIIISDLKRSFTGWLLAHLAGRALSASPIVHVDGPRSVRAAFTPAEIKRLTLEAGFPAVSVKSIWPMRYLLTLARP